MKILQINPVTKYYSTGRSTSELDRFFHTMGHKSYIAAAFPTSREEYKIGSKLDRKIHSFLVRITGMEACFSTIPTIKLSHYIKRIKPDIVKIGVIHSNYLNYYLLMEYLARQKIPVVLVLNDCWHFTGKCVHYSYNNCTKWKTGCGNCPHLENGIPTWFFDRTAILLKKKQKAVKSLPKLAVVGVSQWITNEAKQSILKDASIIQRIYNWVDLKKFYPRESSNSIDITISKEKKIVLGVATNWSKGKGLYDFIRLSEMLGDGYEIVLLGRIDDPSIVNDRIRCVGEVNDVNLLADYYSMSSVFVSLSREESFGKVLAESLACGTPVVCFDSTASPELVGNGCGYVAKPDDLQDVCNGIINVCSKPKSVYSERCIDFAKKNFSFELNAEQYLLLFNKLIGSAESCE